MAGNCPSGIVSRGSLQPSDIEVLGMKRPYLNAISCGRKNVTIEQLERIAEGLGMALHICFR
jgi:hypothetical protein